MTVYCFDRDFTVSTNPKPGRESVPISWIKWLFQETDNYVYATGNQHLRREALIPGIEEARLRWEKMNGYDPQDRYEDDSYYSGYKPSRRNGLRMVKDVHPNEEEFVVVDDIRLHDMEEEGFSYWTPWDFYNAVVDNKLDIPKNPEGYTDEPENVNDINVLSYLKECGFMDEYLNV